MPLVRKISFDIELFKNVFFFCQLLLAVSAALSLIRHAYG
jgi:hypothetical protein